MHHFNKNKDESSTGAVQIMKTLKMKIKNTLNSKIKEFIFNSTRVKVDIFWEKWSLLRNKDDIQKSFT